MGPNESLLVNLVLCSGRPEQRPAGQPRRPIQMVDRDGSKWIGYDQFLEQAEEIRKEYAGDQQEESQTSEEVACRMHVCS